MERALRAVFGALRNAPLFALWREARVVPVALAAQGAIVRALHNWVSSSNTYIADLLRSVSHVRSDGGAYEQPTLLRRATRSLAHTLVLPAAGQGGLVPQRVR